MDQSWVELMQVEVIPASALVVSAGDLMNDFVSKQHDGRRYSEFSEEKEGPVESSHELELCSGIERLLTVEAVEPMESRVEPS